MAKCLPIELTGWPVSAANHITAHLSLTEWYSIVWTCKEMAKVLFIHILHIFVYYIYIEIYYYFTYKIVHNICIFYMLDMFIEIRLTGSWGGREPWASVIWRLAELHGAIYEDRRPHGASKYFVKPLTSPPSPQLLHLPHNMQEHCLAESTYLYKYSIQMPYLLFTSYHIM